MADPIKFVQLDCHLDEKFEYIEAEFGLEGFAVIIKLLQRIYGGQGYYCEWNDRVAMLFAKRIGAGCNVVRETVSAAIRERIFDEEMYRKYGILTSHGIQKRFSEVAKRRAVIFDKPEYVLVPIAQNSDNVCNQASNVCNSTENVCNQTTSKVKQSKAKLSEEKQSSPAAAPPASPYPFDNSSVPENSASDNISGITREILVEKYGSSNVSDYEKKFDEWKVKKGGNIRVDKYSTIAKWLAQDGITKPVNNSSFDIDGEMEKIRERYRQCKGDAL